MHEFEVKSRILWGNRAVFESLPHQAAPAERSWRGVLRVLSGHGVPCPLRGDGEDKAPLKGELAVRSTD